MFGTVAHMRPKPGSEQALLDFAKQWERERKPQVKGAVGGYLFRSEKNPGEYLMVAVFEDRGSYMANANDPEQDRWYRRMRELLVEDPTWEDGEVVGSF
jgi:quinol monooxygenase YgiN